MRTGGRGSASPYDHAGRKTAEYASAVSGQSTSSQLAVWAYDSATLNNPVLASGSKAIGQLAAATSYVGGTGGEAYKQATGSYDPAYRPAQVTWTIPRNAVTGALGGATAGGSASYSFSYTYNIDGSPNTVTYPASGPLAAETVNYGYDNLGSPYSAWSNASDYAEATTYSPDGQPAEIDLGTSTSGQWSRMLYSYDPATLRLNQARIQRESNSWANDSDITYGYDQSGNLTSAADSVTGNNQCYAYHYLARLTSAWAQPAAACPASPPGSSGLGGPAPYQQTLSYDNGGTANGSTSGTTGNLTASTLITGSGSTATTTAAAFTYPQYGAAQPHAPSSQSVTVNGGTPTAHTLNWAGSGAQPGYLATVATGGTTQNSYTWDGTGAVPGQLFSTVTGGTATNYRYDASGSLLVVQDGATSTLYLPGEQITASSTAITSAVRYYTFAGKTIAARTSATALDWLIPGPQGTATTLINTTSQALTRRYYTPYGAQLGTPPAWPGNQGYLGGTTDTTTKLTNLGARQYNPATPLFISPDPILNPAQPTDFNPYAYAFGNPATLSDPTGLLGSYPTPDGSNCVGSLQSCAKVIATQQHNTPGPGTGNGNGGTDTLPKPPPACGGSILNCLGANNLFNEDTPATQGNDLFGNESLKCGALTGGAAAFFACGGGLTATASGEGNPEGQQGSTPSGNGGDDVASALANLASALIRASEDGLATESNLAKVAQHLDNIDALESHPPNAAMVGRIQDAIDTGRQLTEGETNFMIHELTESDLMSEGVDQDLAHEQAMQTHPTFANYDPEVIKQYPEYFNSNWFRYWGIQ